MEVKKTSLLKKRVQVKYLLILWLICISGFGILLAIATNLFTSTIQATELGSSSYFIVLLLGFMLLGFLAFALAVLMAMVDMVKSERTKKIVKSPFFIASVVILAFVVSAFGTKIISPIEERIENNQRTPISGRREIKISPDEIFDLTNNERVKKGLKSLNRNPKLDEAALERAKVIIEYGEWSHEATESGIPYTEAIKKTNYWNIRYGENLANGQYTSAQVVNEWMNSESHRANILEVNYQEVGIATYSGRLNGFNTAVTVQIFGGYQSPNYSQEIIHGWSTVLSKLREIKPSWENIRNFSSTYEANKQDADRMIEIMNIRIYRIEKIVSRMQTKQWLTAEENSWTYEDEKLYNEQEAIAGRLNSQAWK